MKRQLLLTIYLLITFLGICQAQDKTTEKGKEFLQEYISSLQHQIDVTPFVVGIKDLYASANDEGKKNIKELIIQTISEQLVNEQKKTAHSLINIYFALAEQNDEKLPMLYYILGNFYAEQKDSVNLKKNISSIEKYATNSSDANGYIEKLNGYLERMRNYVPAQYQVIGNWITEATDEKGSYAYSLPLYEIEACNKFGKIKYKISGQAINNFNLKHVLGVQVFEYFEDEVFSQYEKEFGSDSLYIFWASETLSNADLQELASRHRATAQFGTEISVCVSNGNSDFGSQLTGHVVGNLAERGANALFDKLFEPQKKIVTIEAWLKRTGRNFFEGIISWKETKVKASSTDLKFKENNTFTTLMRWTEESDVCLMSWYGNPHSPFTSTSKSYAAKTGKKYSKDLQRKADTPFGQAYIQYKKASFKDKPDVLSKYNLQQIEKLKQWCIQQVK